MVERKNAPFHVKQDKQLSSKGTKKRSDQQQQHRVHKNNNLQEEIDRDIRRVGDLESIFSKRAREILQSQKDPEILDLRPFGNELNDFLLNEIAHQISKNLEKMAQFDGNHLDRVDRTCSTLILSGCYKFTPVGMRSFAHAIGQNIRCLDYSKSTISVDVLKVMATGLQRLEALDFSQCPNLLSESIREFVFCCTSSLTKLNLSRCASLNDEALGWIAGSLGVQGPLTQCGKLLSLDISYTINLTDRGLQSLSSGCRALQYINLEGLEKISDTGVRLLIEGCKNLRVLSLRKCIQLTDSTLVHLGRSSQNLRSLNLCGCYKMSSFGIQALTKGVPLLQALNVEGCLLMGEDILAMIATNCLSIQVLNLSGCQEITENGINTLAQHLPFVQRAEKYRGLEPKQDALQLKFSVQQKTIHNSAALRIQAWFRGYRGRIVARSWRVVMVEIPATNKIRRVYQRYRLLKEISQRVVKSRRIRRSAIKIQALTRGVQCRMRLARQEEEIKRIARWTLHAIEIQRMFRGHFTRRRLPLVQNHLQRVRHGQLLVSKENAARKLQKAFRQRFHRSRLDDLIGINQMRRKEKVRAATFIQRLYRTRQTRKTYKQMRQAMEAHHGYMKTLEKYALKLQTVWRGHHGRRQILNARKEMLRRKQRRYDAASRINAGVRGYFGRRLAQQERIALATRYHAAKKIQRAYRFYKTPKADKYSYECMMSKFKNQLVDEELKAAKKQEALLNKTRMNLHRDSASEEEDHVTSIEEIEEDWRDYEDTVHKLQFWFSPSRNKCKYVRPNEHSHAKSLLGMPCRVYWPLEEVWYDGKITKFHPRKRKHRIDYVDGDHEWLKFHEEYNRIQVYNGYCWCMYKMHEPSTRALKAALYLTLRFQKFDNTILSWRYGTIKSYDETSDFFVAEYDDSAAISADGTSQEEWLDLFRSENQIQVQDKLNLKWYSLGSYFFGQTRGKPMMPNKSSTDTTNNTQILYGIEDYLNMAPGDERYFEPYDEYDPTANYDTTGEYQKEAGEEQQKEGEGEAEGDEEGEEEEEEEEKEEKEEKEEEEDEEEDEEEEEEEDGEYGEYGEESEEEMHGDDKGEFDEDSEVEEEEDLGAVEAGEKAARGLEDDEEDDDDEEEGEGEEEEEQTSEYQIELTI